MGITNEKLWNQGLFYGSIHIGTKDDEITSEYDWWSYGRAESEGSRWIELTVEPVHTSTSEVHLAFARGLIRATLRNVTQPVQPLLAADVKAGDKKARLGYKRYCRGSIRQAIQKYGRDSEQHRLLEAKPSLLRTTEGRKALVAKDWAPSWETMTRLEQEQQKVGLLLGPLQPRGVAPTPRRQRLLRLDQEQQKVGPLQARGIAATLRRKRLLRPRSPPTSASIARQPWSSSYGMMNILSHDITPRKGAVGSGPKNHLEPHKSRRPTAERYRIRRIFSPHSPDQEAVKDSMMERRAKRRQPKTSGPWRSKNEMKNILSYDIDPEEADINSSTKGRMAGPRSTPKAARPQTPTYQMKRILSYDIDPEESDVSSSPKGRMKSPRPTSRAPRPQPRTHQGEGPLSARFKTLETKAVRSEAEQRGASLVSRVKHRSQKKYAPSRSIWR